jgi:CRP-like cAMP-binding protein
VATDVFAAVPEQELRLAARRRRFDRGEVVFHRDDPGDSLHRVEHGRFAARIVTPLGETATVSLIGPGEIFGLMAVVGEGRRTATVVALERAETLAIATSVFRRLRDTYPEVREATERLLAAQLAETSNRLVEALYTPVGACDRVWSSWRGSTATWTRARSRSRSARSTSPASSGRRARP